MTSKNFNFDQVIELEQSVVEEKDRLVAIKNDHIKQHNMNKNQIADLKQKLASSEVSLKIEGS